MLKPLYDNSVLVGHLYEDSEVIAFFGQKNIDLKGLQKIFPEYTFSILKQVHGNNLVCTKKAYNKNIEADGQYTNISKLALVIITADCLPVLYKTSNYVVALHCGWKSIEKGLAAHSVKTLSEPIEWAIIGPHIQAERFEVGTEVKDLLLKTHSQFSNGETIVLPHKNSQKCYINLSKMVQRQLADVKNFINMTQCTLNDLNYHSYRRDGQLAGRNLSFVSFK